MFLSNKHNIKEVLLFPAMKPDLGGAAKPPPSSSSSHLPSSSSSSSSSLPSFSALVPTEGGGGLGGVDVGKEDGMKKLAGALGGKSFLGGASPSKVKKTSAAYPPTHPPIRINEPTSSDQSPTHPPTHPIKQKQEDALVFSSLQTGLQSASLSSQRLPPGVRKWYMTVAQFLPAVRAGWA